VIISNTRKNLSGNLLGMKHGGGRDTPWIFLYMNVNILPPSGKRSEHDVINLFIYYNSMLPNMWLPQVILVLIFRAIWKEAAKK
jgi:hypothetical protein